MSGTSMDGIDVALIETDGESYIAFGPSTTRYYRDEERRVLRQAIDEASPLRDRAARPGILREAERLVTILHAAAVQDFLSESGIDWRSVDVVGFHGQTVLHRPQERLTIQIGDGEELAKILQLPVVYDFRAADVAAGGQGAPLVPIFHQALARNLDRPHPIAVVNIGGVANVTFVDGGDPVACDTGPGNALIDDFMRTRTGRPHDPAGVNAEQGEVDEAALARVLAHPFFARRPPKSLDRNEFREWVREQADLDGMSVEDGAATLTAITAASIAAIVPLLPTTPKCWILCGGGVHNVTMMRMLGERLAPAPVESADAAGWSVEAMEAQAFAYLAVRNLRGLPITFPATTNAKAPMAGGVVAVPKIGSLRQHSSS
ncbi:MAG: anhydro-N-acetylmuramic acid kinase [Pseudorhodoplanes sp.]|nr:anhydro-N-acetylmuramic acid kinase [Pseudorhodoplanes sp.]